MSEAFFIPAPEGASTNDQETKINRGGTKIEGRRTRKEEVLSKL
jgi:hypothetical protein